MIENSISLGNILTIIAIVLSAGAAYAEMRSSIRGIKEWNKQTSERLEKMDEYLEALNSRYPEQARLDERINGLDTRFSDYRKTIDDDITRIWNKLLHRTDDRTRRKPSS